jgi:hypothetical protein
MEIALIILAALFGTVVFAACIVGPKTLVRIIRDGFKEGVEEAKRSQRK